MKPDTESIITRIVLIPLLLLLTACATDDPGTPDHDEVPLGVVLMIGDGMGEACLDLLRITRGSTSLDRLPVRGRVLTENVSGRTTDSAAAATAFAAGISTYNGAIAVGPDSLPVETVLEVAESLGMATGLVATSSVTHATPAAFASHIYSRSRQFDIARQMADSGVDVLLGGGWRWFDPSVRPDGLDLLADLEALGYQVFGSGDPLPAAPGSDPASGGTGTVGLYASDGMAHADSRLPSLTAMASFALEALIDDPEGFFLMIEGSQIDWAAHDNDEAWLLDEMIEFDATVAAVLDRLASRPNTLVIVTADHVTGGLSVEEGGTPGEAVFSWTTTGHTSQPVPILSRGFEAARFRGELPNFVIGRILLDLVRAGSITN